MCLMEHLPSTRLRNTSRMTIPSWSKGGPSVHCQTHGEVRRTAPCSPTMFANAQTRSAACSRAPPTTRRRRLRRKHPCPPCNPRCVYREAPANPCGREVPGGARAWTSRICCRQATRHCPCTKSNRDGKDDIMVGDGKDDECLLQEAPRRNCPNVSKKRGIRGTQPRLGSRPFVSYGQ